MHVLYRLLNLFIHNNFEYRPIRVPFSVKCPNISVSLLKE